MAGLEEEVEVDVEPKVEVLLALAVAVAAMCPRRLSVARLVTLPACECGPLRGREWLV